MSRLQITLTDGLKKQIQRLGQKSKPADMICVIKQLCSIRALKLAEISSILRRDPKSLRDRYLTSMIKEQEIEYIYPDNPAHPMQAYRTRQ